MKITKLFNQISTFYKRYIIWPLWTLSFIIYDTWRYTYHSGMFHLKYSTVQKNSRIMAACHVLEKGLTFPAPKKAYGRDLAQFVCSSLNSIKHCPEPYVESVARGVLIEYLKHHDELGVDLGILATNIKRTINSGEITDGGIRQVLIEDFNNKDFISILKTRKSIRDFSGPPQTKQIESAVEMAINTPSACNRQAWRVHWTNNPAYCSIISKLHSGSRGFGDSVPAWMIITVNIGSFQGPRERWAGYVDGGMFAMNLLLSLTKVGLASCPLNWSTSPLNDHHLHKQLNIPSSEVVIMLIAIGTPKEQSTVPISARLPLIEILRNI